MKTSLFLVLLTVSDIALSYPQTITHGYKTCVSCHITTDGGDTLTDYGRGMSEEFMSTFAREGEARELLGLGSLKSIDLGFDYRTIRIEPDGQEAQQFHMYSVGQLAIGYHGITGFGSYGHYGRDRRPQTRSYGVAFHGSSNHSLDGKLGYFLPALGIASNNHDLLIKKANGLGREQERFVRQIGYRGPWLQAKYMMATMELRIEGKNDDNTLKQTGDGPPEHYFQVNINGIVQGLDPGFHRRYEAGTVTLEGWSLRAGKGRVYALIERDRQPVTGIATDYARVGLFPFRGLDLFFEYQAIDRSGARTELRTYGYSWMVRPRVEYEGWLTETVQTQRKTFFSSMKLWL